MTTRASVPSLTLILAAAAVLLFVIVRHDVHALSLLYSRVAIADGELWRLLTSHLLHFSWTHLVADVGSFLLLGLQVERDQGRATFAMLMTFLALGTSAALWLFVPEMHAYGGISALNYGLLTWICLTRRTVVHARWQWSLTVFPAVMLAHIAWQRATESSLLDAGMPQGLRVAWQAHLAGIVLAFACAGLRAAVSSWQWKRVCAAVP
ncbi:MAG: rhombosortase [Pseudomonadota bacterium]|nr:rhombosortase [Pseudomonadota bacterium]